MESNSYGESDASGAKGTQGPIPSGGMGRRIADVADAVGTRKIAAEIMGVSVDALQRYIREENAPTFEALARLCLAANVRMEWVATGIGYMRENPWRATQVRESSDEYGAIYKPRLRLSARLLRMVMNSAMRDLQPDDLADELFWTYNWLQANGDSLTAENVADFNAYFAQRGRG